MEDRSNTKIILFVCLGFFSGVMVGLSVAILPILPSSALATEALYPKGDEETSLMGSDNKSILPILPSSALATEALYPKGDKETSLMGSDRKTIRQIFQESGTDKEWHHRYDRYYHSELAPYRDIKGLRILEIGAYSGKSLGSWLQYFSSPGAVQGIAYNVDTKAAKARACKQFPKHCSVLTIYSLDQSDPAALRDLVAKNPEGWDIIIEDGSHKPQHFLISFYFLWPNIRPGGLYALEDIETNYMDNGKRIYGYALHGGIGVKTIGKDGPENAVEPFKDLADVVSRSHFSRPRFTVMDGIDKDVVSVTFGDSIIFVHKKPTGDWDHRGGRMFVGPPDNERTYSAYVKEKAPLNAWFHNLGLRKLREIIEEWF